MTKCPTCYADITPKGSRGHARLCQVERSLAAEKKRQAWEEAVVDLLLDMEHAWDCVCAETQEVCFRCQAENMRKAYYAWKDARV